MTCPGDSIGPSHHNLLAGFELARWHFTYFWNQGAGPHINLFNPSRLASRLPLFAEQAVGRRRGNLPAGSDSSIEEVACAGWRADRLFRPANGTSFDLPAIEQRHVVQCCSARAFDVAGDARQSVLATISASPIWKDNVVTPDINNPPFSVSAGQQTSKGIEFELKGRLRRNWSVAADYAFTQAYVSRDNSIRVGAILPRTPRHAPGVLSTWQFENGPLSGLSIGGGVYAATERTISVFSPVILDGYTRGEIFGAYARNRWRLRVNLKNVSNTRWFDGGSFGITPQAPRHVLAGLDYTF